MRNDLAQLLVETPRSNRGELYREHRRKADRNPEDAPTKQGMRRPYFERKQFGEYFAPLKGLLRKNVGRPWSAVFSEITASLRGGGAVIEHTKLHLLRDFVITSPHWVNGKPHWPVHRFGCNGPTPLNDDFYVDRFGFLRLAPRVVRRKHNEPASFVRIDDHAAYHKIDGAWFRVWTRLLPLPGPGNAPVYDLVLKRWVRCHGHSSRYYKPEEVFCRWQLDGAHDTWQLDRLHGSNRYAYRKEQISKRTIRREGLDKLKAG